MRGFHLILYTLAFLSMQACSPNSGENDLDQSIANALSNSEQSLYQANFKEALQYIASTKFDKSEHFGDKHRIQLLVQELRIHGFQNILFRFEPDRQTNLERLKDLYASAMEIKEEGIKADYFVSLSAAYRSTGKTDSAQVLEDLALRLYLKVQKIDKIAQLNANAISRKHNQYFTEGKKVKILALIPQYQQLVESSSKQSQYALAYNTRHLAQIHRRQTLEYDKSLTLFQASLSARKEISFKPFIPASYSSIGDVYLAMENHEKAIETYTISQTLATEIGFVRYEYYPLLKMGDIEVTRGNLEKARDYYNRALISANANNYESAIKEVNTNLKNLGDRN